MKDEFKIILHDKMFWILIILSIVVVILMLELHTCVKEGGNNDIKIDKDTVKIHDNILEHGEHTVYIPPSGTVTITMPHYIQVPISSIPGLRDSLQTPNDSIYILSGLPVVHVQKYGFQKQVCILIAAGSEASILDPHIHVGLSYNFFYIHRFNVGIALTSDIKSIKNSVLALSFMYNIPKFQNTKLYLGIGTNISLKPIIQAGIGLAL